MSKNIELNQVSYDKIAEPFSATRSFVWKDMETLTDFIKPGQKVLDLGCGNGRLLELLQDKNIQYLGMDNSVELLRLARQKYPEANFAVGDFLTLEKNEVLQNQEFDVIFLISSFNHLPKENQEKVLRQIKKFLKPNGLLLMINWNLWNIFARKSVWRKYESWSEIKELLSDENKKEWHHWRDVFTLWQSGKNEVVLYYYAFLRGEIKKLLTRNGFEIVKNYYSIKGNVASVFCGRNIVTVARNQHNFLLKKKSGIQGKGIFTLQEIKAGEEFYRIPLEKLRYENFYRHAYVGNGQYVCDEKVLNFVNHSCDPNVKLDIERIDPVLIALREIKIGEEITCNYNFTEKSGVFCECRCGEKNCLGHFGKKDKKKFLNLGDEDFE
ncbi:MAG: methyltransferase domain-containing protein [Patescibacteria group bacterium]